MSNMLVIVGGESRRDIPFDLNTIIIDGKENYLCWFIK